MFDTEQILDSTLRPRVVCALQSDDEPRGMGAASESMPAAGIALPIRYGQKLTIRDEARTAGLVHCSPSGGAGVCRAGAETQKPSSRKTRIATRRLGSSTIGRASYHGVDNDERVKGQASRPALSLCAPHATYPAPPVPRRQEKLRTKSPWGESGYAARRLGVNRAAYAVAGERADDAEAVGDDAALDRAADCRNQLAGAHGVDGARERSLCRIAQAPCDGA